MVTIFSFDHMTGENRELCACSFVFCLLYVVYAMQRTTYYIVCVYNLLYILLGHERRRVVVMLY